MSDKHLLSVTQSDWESAREKWSPSCSCGWVGYLRNSALNALADGEEHLGSLAVSDAPQMGGEPSHAVADPLVVFLYKLLRDHVQPGDVEGAVLEAEGTNVVALSNRFLAEYAVNIAARLRRP